MTRVLVVGPGYVGSTLALALRDSGHVVYALKRRSMDLEGIEIVAADITDPSALDLPDVDVALFTAAPDSRDEGAYRALYVDGLRNLRTSLGTATRIIFTSSTAVYGQDDGSLVDESSPTSPRDFRGQVLLEAEAMASVTLRLGGIYGPGRMRALERVRAKQPHPQPGRFLNLIHRDDVCGALEHLTTLEEPRSVYNGVDGEPVESERLYQWLAEADGRPPPSARGSNGGSGKRCSNAALTASGYTFKYPTYQQGYGELLKRRIFEPCPSRMNCVSSRARESTHRMDALGFSGSAAEVQTGIERALEGLGGRVVFLEPGYLRAEFSSRVFGFVDDVEVAVDAWTHTIDFCSASRSGYWDFGVNRRRMSKLWRRVAKSGNIFPQRSPS